MFHNHLCSMPKELNFNIFFEIFDCAIDFIGFDLYTRHIVLFKKINLEVNSIDVN